MATFESETFTYDAVRAPEVVLLKETNPFTGRVFYTATINLLELAPTRTTTSEERVAGISSIDPPVVRSQVPQELINLAVRACGSSYENTEGFTMTGEVYSSLSYTIPFAVAGALRLAGVDI